MSTKQFMPLSDSIMSRLTYQHETVGELIEGFSDHQLKTRSVEGKWSPFEQIVHLVSYQPTFLGRVEKMLTSLRPRFERYVAENDPLFHAYLEYSLSDLFRTLHHDRQLLLNQLRGLTEDQLRRQGEHGKYGLLTLTQWTDLFLLHEAHHLWAILQLVSMYRVGPGVQS